MGQEVRVDLSAFGAHAKPDRARAAKKAVFRVANTANVSGCLNPSAREQNVTWLEPMPREFLCLLGRDVREY